MLDMPRGRFWEMRFLKSQKKVYICVCMKNRRADLRLSKFFMYITCEKFILCPNFLHISPKNANSIQDGYCNNIVDEIYC